MHTKTLLMLSALVLLGAPFGRLEAKEDPAKQAVEAFKEKMKTADEGGRVRLIQEFSKSGNPGAAGAIGSWLGNRSQAVKIAAIAAIGRLKDKKYEGRLLSMVKQAKKEPKVLAAIMRALGEYADPKTKKTLIDTAKKWLVKDSEVASAAALAMGNIKDRKTVDELIKLLEQTNPSLPANSSKSISQETYRLLDKSRPAIVKALQNLTGWNFYQGDAWKRFWERESKNWSPKRTERDLTKLDRWDDPGYGFVLRKPAKDWIFETNFDAARSRYQIVLSKRRENMDLAKFFIDVYESSKSPAEEIDRMLDYYKKNWKDVRGDSIKQREVRLGKHRGRELSFVGRSSSGSVLRERNQYYKIGKLMYGLGSWARSGLDKKAQGELDKIFQTFQFKL